MRLEEVILNSLYYNEEYSRKVVPYLSEKFFHDKSEMIVFGVIEEYLFKYNELPTKEAILIEVENLGLQENIHKEVNEKIKAVENAKSEYKLEWLLDRTEEFGKEQKIFNAMRDGIAIMDGKDKKHDKGEILELLRDALGYSFDNVIGHDYLEDWERRLEFYNTVESKVPFDLKIFNEITRGGFSRKTLNMFLAGTNVGKTLIMCHMAAANLMDGKNVLYVTAEESEEKISERIDANLLDCPIRDVAELPRIIFEKKLSQLKSDTPGKLVVKEYPNASANAGHIRHLLNELEIKKNFIPDIVYIDYLNLLTSQRYKDGTQGMYAVVGSISQELRGLMVEKNMVGVSATQVNREGFRNSDFDLSSTSESFAVPMNVDSMYGIVETEELEHLGQYKVNQLKSRYVDKGLYKSFIIGVDKSKMRLYDVENSAGDNITDLPVMDKGSVFDSLKVN